MPHKLFVIQAMAWITDHSMIRLFSTIWILDYIVCYSNPYCTPMKIQSADLETNSACHACQFCLSCLPITHVFKSGADFLRFSLDDLSSFTSDYFENGVVATLGPWLLVPTHVHWNWSNFFTANSEMGIQIIIRTGQCTFGIEFNFEI